MLPPSSTIDSEARLIALLQGRGLLTAEGIERLRLAAATSATPLSAAATRLGLVAEREMATVFATMLGVEVVDRSSLPIHPFMPHGLNRRFARARHVLPLDERDGVLRLAMANPLDEAARAGVAFATGRQVAPVVALESDIEDFYHRHSEAADEATVPFQGPASSGSDDQDRLSDRASDAPVIRLVQRVLTAAMDCAASDVHLEPSTDSLVIRYRIDGLLQQTEVLSARWSEAVASRVKLMARLDIAEKRIPQDGRIRFSARGQSVDVRVATFPTLHGEAVVLRLLGQQTVSLRLDAIGLPETGLAELREALGRPHGICLITGPTGSGKTTTLYAALNEIHRPERKLVTVEDPIEYTLAGVSQLQVKPDIGLTYAAALRSVLRNDPDVIMIGEIRDRETADIAVRAALTGHLVLATLHTNTAAGAVTRLLDLGVEDFLLSSTLVYSAAQRLVRRLCPACKDTAPVSDDQARWFTDALGASRVPDRVPVATGCQRCAHRGFRGRMPLFEGLPIGADERNLIRNFRSEDALAGCAAARGGWTLWRHGVEKVLEGETTLDEVLSVVEDRPK